MIEQHCQPLLKSLPVIYLLFKGYFNRSHNPHSENTFFVAQSINGRDRLILNLRYTTRHKSKGK